MNLRITGWRFRSERLSYHTRLGCSINQNLTSKIICYKSIKQNMRWQREREVFSGRTGWTYRLDVGLVNATDLLSVGINCMEITRKRIISWRMESAPDLETVYQAVYSLYNNSNPSGPGKTSQWLDELQKSVSYLLAVFCQLPSGVFFPRILSVHRIAL